MLEDDAQAAADFEQLRAVETAGATLFDERRPATLNVPYGFKQLHQLFVGAKNDVG